MLNNISSYITRSNIKMSKLFSDISTHSSFLSEEEYHENWLKGKFAWINNEIMKLAFLSTFLEYLSWGTKIKSKTEILKSGKE